jgi:hypothetical protein
VSRLSLRRFGGIVLLLLWAQVATANALPCGLECALAKEMIHHEHHDMGNDHPIGHHMGGATISAPEHCGTPQLLVAMFVPPEFPVSPSVNVPLGIPTDSPATAFVSAVTEFATPPPRA